MSVTSFLLFALFYCAEEEVREDQPQPGRRRGKSSLLQVRYVCKATTQKREALPVLYPRVCAGHVCAYIYFLLVSETRQATCTSSIF
jgi:hypothetical protein